MYDKILLEKYIHIRENTNGNISDLLNNVKELVSKSIADGTASTELSTAFNQLLLGLLNSADNSVKQAAAMALNKQPQVAKEEDEPIANSGDSVKGVGF